MEIFLNFAKKIVLLYVCLQMIEPLISEQKVRHFIRKMMGIMIGVWILQGVQESVKQLDILGFDRKNESKAEQKISSWEEKVDEIVETTLEPEKEWERK